MDGQWMWQHLGVWSNVVEHGSPGVFPNRLWQQCRKEAVTGQGTLPSSPSLASFLLSQFPQSVSMGPLGTEVSQHLWGQHAPATVRGFAACLWPLADNTARKERQMEETWGVTAAGMAGAVALPLG